MHSRPFSWAINTCDTTKGLPVVVFNPHGFDAEQLVQVNKQYSRVLDVGGNEVPSQLVHSSTYECYWRQDTMFKAHVPALGYAVYYLSEAEPAAEEDIATDVGAAASALSSCGAYAAAYQWCFIY